MTLSDGELLILITIILNAVLMAVLFFILLDKITFIAFVINETKCAVLERTLICKRVESVTKDIAEKAEKAIVRNPTKKEDDND